MLLNMESELGSFTNTATVFKVIITLMNKHRL